MKPYTDLNNEKRTQCSINKDKIGVESYKLMSNSIFGKQMENVRKYKDIRIVNNSNKGKKLAAKTTYKDVHILSDTVALYEMRKTNLLLDKPIPIGFVVLDIAKIIMYEHRNRLKKVFEDDMFIIYMDTDSLKLLIAEKNIYEEIKEIIEHIDTSNFDKNTNKPITPGLNGKKLGVLKFENGDKSIKKIYCKSSKTYLEIFSDDNYEIKAKGLKKGFKKDIKISDFDNTLSTEKSHQIKETHIVSKGMNMSIEETFKDVMPVFGNKRETHLGLNKTIARGYLGKKYQPLLNTFRNYHPPSKNK